MECDASGINGQPDVCRSIGVKAYPTWVVNNRHREGVLSLDQLADMSGFRHADNAAGK